MKIVFSKDIICAAVAPLMSGISTKNAMPATEGILIEATRPDTVTLTTYDLEKGVRLTIKADIIEEGAAIINANKFSSTVRAMDGGDITLTVDNTRLTASILCGKSSHTMSALPAKDFPELPRLTSPNGFIAAQKTIKDMIAKCAFAMGVTDQRPVLNGLFMMVDGDLLTAVSCDSFKMALCSTTADMENISAEGRAMNFKFIIPNRSVGELSKLLSGKDEETVRIYMSRKNIIFVTEDVTFFSRLIDGEYIDYNRIILRNHRITVEVDREFLLSALERAALITEEKIAGSVRSHVKLEAVDNLLKISAVSNAGSSYDELTVCHTGDPIVIAFNNRYLMDSLRASDATRVRLSLSSPLASMNIEPADEDRDESNSELFMLLPVRMKD